MEERSGSEPREKEIEYDPPGVDDVVGPEEMAREMQYAANTYSDAPR